ncbi:hypothetical protein TNCV_3223571 [Trichonephila clavipes]|nr:hypothetical protein TNCV_3223571 [Trichonephila clavipes]
MDVCKCVIVPSRQGDILNSGRAASPHVRKLGLTGKFDRSRVCVSSPNVRAWEALLSPSAGPNSVERGGGYSVQSIVSSGQLQIEKHGKGSMRQKCLGTSD